MFLGCLNVVRKPHRLLLVLLLLLMLLLTSNFITRDWLDLGQIFKKHYMRVCIQIGGIREVMRRWRRRQSEHDLIGSALHAAYAMRFSFVVGTRL